MKKIWEVRTYNIDGSASKSLAFFTRQREAATLVQEDTTYSFLVEHIVYDSVADFEENNPDAQRRKALAKLTQEEQTLLGLARY